MYLRINSPNVVREFFDGEVVVVNLESGTYYSLENAASKIWLLFEQGLSDGEIVNRLSEKYKSDAGTLRPSFERFVGELLTEKLVVTFSEAPSSIDEKAVAKILDILGPYVEPSLRKYNDMQDLLLLDPIHDVDEAGWPATKQGNER